jgi:hypothetical protein
MIERLFLRSTYYGSPFKNLDAGRDERDFENKDKMQKALTNYLQSEGFLYLYIPIRMCPS